MSLTGSKTGGRALLRRIRRSERKWKSLIWVDRFHLPILDNFQFVAEHDILPGTGRISRKKEHFEGLLKAIREQNMENFQTRVEKLMNSPLNVESEAFSFLSRTTCFILS